MSDTNGLFEIRLSDDGIKYIKKFAIANRILLLIGAVLFLLYVYTAINRFFHDKFDYSGLESFQIFYFKSAPYSAILYAVLFVMQLFYYRRFRKLMIDGVTYKNELVFNKAFKAIYLNAIWGIVTLIFGLGVALLDVVYRIKYLS